MENIYAERIERLRSLMEENSWDAVIVSGSDPHASEYPAARWKQVEWLTGFTGEAGDVVITLDHAGLWTDTRYFIQAEKQLEDTGVALHKTRVPEEVLIPQWLSEKFPEGKTVVALDGLCQKKSDIDDIVSYFDGRCEIANVPDMLDAIWETRPGIPSSPIITLGDEIVGQSRESKISWLRKNMQAGGIDAMLVSALDEIAWLLNIRASDVMYNPVAVSYLIVTEEDVRWYVKKGLISRSDSETEDSFYELRADEVTILDYDELEFGISELTENCSRLFVDEKSLNYNLFHLISMAGFGEGRLIAGTSPVVLQKSIKNATEIEGMREAHVEDGIAMEKFIFWLEKELGSGNEVTEWSAAEKLNSLRAGIPGYRDLSFETISAYGAGAALPHYVTPRENSPVLHKRGLYLCDSGGQYMFGTTDITRTIPLGPCSFLEKEDYTLALKGHIGLASAVFPYGTAGCQIDCLARIPLWKNRRNFGHGTGHGVGFYLNVHEGPQDIRQNFNRQAILPGMITSDEPGIYREGMHGVRHESLLLCKCAEVNGFGKWLEFEPLTLCHIDTSAIIIDLMDEEEIRWLDNYNSKVYTSLAPRLPEEIAEWLKIKTAPVSR